MIRPLTDLHTHTIASGHAFSTFTELAAGAAAAGLELIAVTDHGPACPGAAHEWYFMNLRVAPSVLGGVRVLKGVEANPVPDTDNGIDLPDELLAVLDFVAVGLHPQTGWDDASSLERTEALLRAIANPLVDMVTHPGNPTFPLDIERIVDACVRHDVIVEFNNASFEPASSRSRDTMRELAFARAAVEAGALVAINSDAHYHAYVGRFGRALEVAEQLGLREDRLVSRDAATVLAHLTARRERPRLEWGGVH